jgi:hypothetical protein
VKNDPNHKTACTRRYSWHDHILPSGDLGCGMMYPCKKCKRKFDTKNLFVSEANGQAYCEKCIKTISVVLREEVAWFARKMEVQLRRHEYKGGWDDSTSEYLLDRLVQEAEELREAIRSKKSERVTAEAADVANFAMMLADVFNRRDS